MTSAGLQVAGIIEGGPVVRGTLDVDAARSALREWAAAELANIHGDLAIESEDIPAWAADTPVERVGLFRWNPCAPASCWDGGNHRGHLGYAEKPGRGVWQGVLFQ